jgi:hypothetical protein
VFTGYLTLGCNEILSRARAYGYSHTADCPVHWLKLPECGDIASALAERAYDYDNISDAPWYDEEDEPTHRFFGAYPTRIDQITDSTRTATLTEGILDGGTINGVRHAIRTIRCTAVLTAQGEDALEAGFSWLDAALRPDECGIHGASCGEADATFFAACPRSPEDFTKVETQWDRGVINLATNPSMESAGSPTLMLTNLATNPSFEQATASTVEVRRNLAHDPRATGATVPTGRWGFSARWYGGTGAGTTTLVTGAADGPAGGPNSYQRKTWSASGGAGDTGFTLAQSDAPTGVSVLGYPVVAAQVFTISAWMRATWVGAARTANIQVFWRDAAGNPITNSVSPIVSLTSGAWVRISHTVTAPAGAAFLGANIDPDTGPNWLIGETLDATGLLVELSPVLGSYFDGSTIAAGDYSYAWTGAANATPSVQIGTAVPGVSNESAGGAAVSLKSTEWASSGTQSARVLNRTGTTNYAFSTLPVEVGKTYTVLVKSRTLSAASTPTVPLGVWAGGGSTIDVSGVISTTFAGVQEWRLTFTVTAAAGFVRLRLPAHNTIGESLWFDDLLVVEGVYNGPYFDGATRSRVRRNLQPYPTLQAGWQGGVDNGGTAQSAISSTDGPAGVSPFYRRLTVQTLGGSGTINHYSGTVAQPAVTPGQTVTHSIYGRAQASLGAATAYAAVYWFTATNAMIGGIVVGAASVVDGTWRRYTVTATAPAGAAKVRVDLRSDFVGKYTVGDWLDAAAAMVEFGSVLNPYFDGTVPIAPYAAAWEGTAHASRSYLYDPDFFPVWTGTANASTTALNAADVNSYSGGAASKRVSSTHWATDRTKSMRIIPLTSSTDSYASPGGDTGGMRLQMQPGKTYTVAANIRLTAAQTGVLNPRARKMVSFVKSAALPGYTEVSAAAAPNAAGVTRLIHTFTTPADATEAFIRLYNGASSGGGDVWWDSLILVEGEYDGTYFDGYGVDTEDPPTEYDWTGPADASPSRAQFGSRVEVPDPVAYAAYVEGLVRVLHGVVAISGPIVQQKMRRGDVYGYIVQFTLAAGVPFVFTLPEEVTLDPASPSIVQDDPVNLVNYPSAGLGTGTVEVARNYSMNPSAEGSALGWQAIYDTTTTSGGVSTAAVSTETASVGAQSVKTTWTAPNTSAVPGWIAMQQGVQLAHAVTAGERYSFNIWGQGEIESGTVVLGALEVQVEWRGASGLISTVGLGIIAGGSGAVSAKSIAPPVGATIAVVRVLQRVTSWSTGAKVRLYADALAVTVP